jgi:hypothetical protein
VIGSLSFLLVTVLIPGQPDDEMIEIMKKASEELKKVIELTSKAQGNIPLQPVKPQYIYSSDDNVEYVYAVTSDAPDPFRVVASKHASGAGDCSKYKEDNSKQMSGMRVKRSWIFNAVEQVAWLRTLLWHRQTMHPQTQDLKLQGCVWWGKGGINQVIH